jgi:hypothetical protein
VVDYYPSAAQTQLLCLGPTVQRLLYTKIKKSLLNSSIFLNTFLFFVEFVIKKALSADRKHALLAVDYSHSVRFFFHICPLQPVAKQRKFSRGRQNCVFNKTEQLGKTISGPQKIFYSTPLT